MPLYVRQLYRDAIKRHSPKATFDELAVSMSIHSGMNGNPKIEINRWHLIRWFEKNNGQLKAPNSRPLLTTEHVELRQKYVDEWAVKFCDPTTPVAYLDEKWFYPESRRRKLKYLPRVDGEEEGCDILKRPRQVSRRHPVKVMAIGCVARPRSDKQFDGRIFFERIGQEEKLKKRTTNHRFVDEACLNYELKEGKWRLFHVEGMKIEELKDIIIDQYNMDDEIADRLELAYHEFIGNQGKKLWKTLANDAKIEDIKFRKTRNGEKEVLTLLDVDLRVRYEKGEIVFRDANCDSDYMLEVMPRIGQAIRDAFHWVDETDVVFLVMDNAGGHGTDETVNFYMMYLWNTFKIMVVHQVPRSPETNVLDLGIWMSIQAVERAHKGKRVDAEALHKSMQEAWNRLLKPGVFESVFKRLVRVFEMITKDKGGNNLVESNRGKLTADPMTTDEISML